MNLTQNLKGLSKLALLLLFVISFLLGAILSYVWTMGFYSPIEFSLPNQPSLTIENVQFYPEQPTLFNMTVLNPSYSPSDAKIEQINVHTTDGKLHSVASTSPTLSSLSIAPGKSETITSYWNWANYTDQKVDVYVILAEGSGPAIEARTAFMNLTVTDIVFEPSITSTWLNIRVESKGSPVSVDIDKISVNETEVTDTTPALPYKLDPNATVTFTLRHDWADLQNKTVTVAVRTTQGYVAAKSVNTPQMKLGVSSIAFDSVATSYFNITIENSQASAAKVDINLITANVEGQNITIEITDPALPQSLEPGSDPLLLKCTWDWSSFKGKSVIITVYTAQGFKGSMETTVPNTP